MKRKILYFFTILLALFVAANLINENTFSLQYAYAADDEDAAESIEPAEKVQPKSLEIPQIPEEYNIVETYETDWPDFMSYNIKYDKYDVYPNYIVNLSSYSRKIYEQPDKSSEVLEKIRYGNKCQTIALIKNEDESLWYVVVFEDEEDDGKTKLGYVREERVDKREFQLDVMKEYLDDVTSFHGMGHIVYVENYRYKNGYPPRMPNGSYYDDYGYRRGQSIAGYYSSDFEGKFRYIQDGMLGVVEQVIVTTDATEDAIVIDGKGHFVAKEELSDYFPQGDNAADDAAKSSTSDDEEGPKTPVELYNANTEVQAVKLYIPSFGESLWVKPVYISEDEKSPDVLNQTIIVDRKNQNIVVFEYNDGWEIISMSYASTGKVGEFSLPTPLGYYMAISKKIKFDYLEDGTFDIVGFAPYAIRFSGGGYLHGVPMAYSFNEQGNKVSPGYYEEYLSSIGTVPRSHMCVRNYTSHAEFMYNWIDIGNCAVIVIE